MSKQENSLNFLLATNQNCGVSWSRPTSAVVLMVADELRNGAEQVLFGHVEPGLSALRLSYLVMLHSGILLPISPEECGAKRRFHATDPRGAF